MPVTFECSCGKQLRVADELSGKRIRCPACKEVQTVPEPAAASPITTKAPARPAIASASFGPAMVRFECGCGKIMQAKAEFAGRSTRCPACQSTLTIPASDEAAGPTGIRADRSVPRKGTVADDEDWAEAPARGRPRRGRKRQQKSPWLWVGLAAGLLLLIGGGIGAFFWLRGGKATGDLALVPSDAQAIVTVRVADVWKLDLTQSLLKMAPIPGGGDPAAEMEKETGLTPTDVERATVVFTDLQGSGRFLVIVATNKTYDRQKLLNEAKAPKVQTEYKGKKYHVKDGEAMYLADDRTFVVGDEISVKACIDQQTSPQKMDDGLSAALKLAAGKNHVVAWGKIPPGALQQAGAQLPPQAAQFKPLLETKDVTATIDLGKELVLDVTLGFNSAPKAEAGKKAAEEGVKLAKAFMPLLKMQMGGAGAQAKEAQQAMDNLEKTLNSLAIDQKGSGVHVGLKTELNPAILAGVLLPAMQKVGGAAQKVEASNNLRQIALAMHIYHDTHGHFPPAVIYSKDGKTPLYSWRVELLPYLEQQALYEQFKKDEPWNGPNNVKLIQKMPQVYALPGQKNTSMTNYKVFVTKSPKGAPPPNNGAPFGDDRKVKMTDITDGTSNTIMIAESAMMVQWTQPVDIEFDPKGPVPPLGARPGSQTFDVAMFDGSVRALSKTIKPDVLKAAITPRGGEVVNLDK